ncbi:MAG TPA: hypothetical protein V6C95_23520, partial [Coleofasciculaceae cyanobacterium]
MTRGRKQKYKQPKDRALYVKLTLDAQLRLQAKALEYNLSQSELIEQFARGVWLNAQELELVEYVFLRFREDLVKELGRTPDLERSSQLGYLLVQLNQVLQ